MTVSPSSVRMAFIAFLMRCSPASRISSGYSQNSPAPLSFLFRARVLMHFKSEGHQNAREEKEKKMGSLIASARTASASRPRRAKALAHCVRGVVSSKEKERKQRTEQTTEIAHGVRWARSRALQKTKRKNGARQPQVRGVRPILFV